MAFLASAACTTQRPATVRATSTQYAPDAALSRSAEDERRDYEAADAAIERCKRGDPAPVYFPPETFPFFRCWYAVALAAMHERPLWPPAPASETYRFTWLPWRGLALSARVDLRATDGFAAAVGMTGNGDAPGVPSQRAHGTIDLALRGKIAAAVRAAHFWDSESYVHNPGRDGAEWILEGVRDGHYRASNLWVRDARQNPAFRQLCLLLVESAGFQVRETQW